MGHFYDRLRHAGLLLVLCCSIAVSYGCATTPKQAEDLPPILAQDELLRPYLRVGVIQVRRDRYGAPEDLSPADYDWGYHVLREEAAKIGADAVILPEVKAKRQTYIFFPSSEMTAKGVAIKFR